MFRTLYSGAAGMALLSAFAALPAGAQGLAPLEWETSGGGKFTVYGQINKGVLSYDDGQATNSYGLIDNNNSNTRAGLRWSQPLDTWTLGTRIEIQYAPFSTANANQLNPDINDWQFDNDNIRWIDFSAKSGAIGTFSLGQGSMSTDGIAEIDLSGTDVIAYASVGDSATAQLLTYDQPDLAGFYGPKIGSVFNDYDGSRYVRVRYDTKSFNGFSFAAAYGRNLLSSDSDIRDINQYDAAIRYENKFDAFQIKGGIGYAANDDDLTTWAGSVSALHNATGINGTLAMGTRDNDGQSGEYYYGKLGMLRDFVSWGATAMSVDYYHGEDIYTASDVSVVNDQGDVLLAGNIDGSTSDSYGFALVQKVAAANTELWLTYRKYEFSDDLTSYGDGQAIFGGARFKF